MFKPALVSSLSLLLLLSGCSEKKEKETASKEVQQKAETPVIESNISTSVVPTQLEKPFMPSLELNTTQDNEPVTESLEELEAEAFKTIQPQIIDEMRKIPECLEQAESKEDAFACSQPLRALNKELALAMGDFSEEEETGYDDDFVWNEETKVNMIKEIEAGTQAMQEIQTCMETSKSPEELAKCMEL